MTENSAVPKLTKEIQELIEKKAPGKKFIFSLTMMEEQSEKSISCDASITSNADDSKTPFSVIRALTGSHWQTTKALLSKFDLNNIRQSDIGRIGDKNE